MSENKQSEKFNKIIQWEIYNNLIKFAEEYRNYTIISDKIVDYDKFIKIINEENKIDIKCEETLIILLNKYNEASSKTESFKKLLNTVDKEENNVIIVSEKPISKQIKKKYDLFDFEIYNYVYDLFKIEIPKGPFCFPHSILNEEERTEILNALNITYKQLPKIKLSDPQIIWIGAKPGDIVKIIRNNPITGKEIAYRYVFKV